MSGTTLSPEGGIIDVCSFGNVVLRTGQGDDVVRIRVSKDIMSVASPFFRTLLQGPFKEATQDEVELLEEDGKTLLDFCYIVQCLPHQVQDVNKEMLFRLVEFAERRDAIKAIMPWMGLQLLRTFHTSSHKGVLGNIPDALGIGIKLRELLTIAYVCQIPDVFWKASRTYLAYQSIDQDFAAESCEVVVECSQMSDIFKSLEAKRRQTLRNSVSQLKSALQLAYTCNNAHMKLGQLTNLLFTHAIDMFKLATFEASQAKALDLFQSATDFARNDMDRTFCNAITYGCTCNRFASRLQDIVTAMSKMPPGMCLQCYSEERELRSPILHVVEMEQELNG